MKRNLALFLLVTMLFGTIFTAVSCTEADNDFEKSDEKSDNESVDGDDESNDKTNTESNDDSVNKFSGKIAAGTPFSEGLAIVTDGTKVYCINENGNIVYELDEKYASYGGGYHSRGYQNGYVKIGDNLYDKTGKVTKPSDLGVTKLYDYALAGGYIVAEKEESTYSSTKKYLGILNTDLEWIIPLSEELYSSAEKLTRASIYATAIEGYIFDSNAGFVFEVSTKTMYDFKDAPDGLGENAWRFSMGYCVDPTGEIIFKLESGENTFTTSHSESRWVDGKLPIYLYNESARKYFVTVIDTTGKFLFEPLALDFDYSNYGLSIEFDGTYLVVSKDVIDTDAIVLDTSGNVVSKSNSPFRAEVVISDGIINLYAFDAYGRGGVTYYDINFNKLFG